MSDKREDSPTGEYPEGVPDEEKPERFETSTGDDDGDDDGEAEPADDGK